MHLRFGAASAVVSAPFSPDSAAEVFRCAQRLVPGDGPRGRRLPRPGILAGRYDGIGVPVGDSVVALARVIRSVGSDRADFHTGGDLVKELGQHGRVADVTPGDLDGPDLQRLFVDTDVDLAPQTAFRATMLAGVPLAFAFRLDAGAVDQQVQRPLRAAVGDGHGQGLLPPAQRAEVRHSPVEANQAQQAFHEPGCLPESHAEEELHRQARLNCGIAILRLPSPLAGRWWHPGHVRIEPDGQGTTLLQRLVVGRPVLGLVARRDGSAHARQLPRWIRKMNPP